jgi:predicted SprT family Zn-dependent metalloprotease
MITKTEEEEVETNKDSFWCTCESKEFKDHDILIERGHSVDVICGDCCGYLQVG